MPNFKEAVETMSELIRWVPEPKNAKDKSSYIGPVVTGYYLEKKEKVGQNESNLYEIEVTDPATHAGHKMAVWGSSLLDGKFSEIPVGCMVRISYLGVAQPKTPKGRAYQNLKVEYDASTKKPMTEAAPTAPANVAAAPVAPAQNGFDGF